ncbi:UNVERIFIED_ORG: hypothetical protein GCAPEGMB_00199 [Vibrio phage V07]|nr:hypothetical protein pp2_158 [Vibrio phage phi-pp2]QIW90876.1 hypothetical protein COHAPHLL_00013 [Vibrio phage V09]UNA02068.1 hypothetical protein [Vibrio phage PC-Liy1]URQ03367.1 hypothetical protein PVA8_381 [Vibrio phage PVA8]WBM59100.1 hypothetical protein vBValMPVA8_378 [Vibrio phage vB_ValM_PVA8]WOL24695.1 hypothetical protein [Vibrio phage PG216]
MNINLLIRNEVKNNTSRYATAYDIMDDMLEKFPQARASAAKNDGTMKNSTLRREIARALDNSSNWKAIGKTETGRKLYERLPNGNSLENFV